MDIHTILIRAEPPPRLQKTTTTAQRKTRARFVSNTTQASQGPLANFYSLTSRHGQPCPSHATPLHKHNTTTAITPYHHHNYQDKHAYDIHYPYTQSRAEQSKAEQSSGELDRAKARSDLPRKQKHTQSTSKADNNSNESVKQDKQQRHSNARSSRHQPISV